MSCAIQCNIVGFIPYLGYCGMHDIIIRDQRNYWRSHSQFMSIEICGMCRYYYYCMCIVGSKVITFATSTIFENIALKTAGK